MPALVMTEREETMQGIARAWLVAAAPLNIQGQGHCGPRAVQIQSSCVLLARSVLFGWINLIPLLDPHTISRGKRTFFFLTQDNPISVTNVADIHEFGVFGKVGNWK